MQLVALILIRWIVIYPVDSAIQRLNNRRLVSQQHIPTQTFVKEPSLGSHVQSRCPSLQLSI